MYDWLSMLVFDKPCMDWKHHTWLTFPMSNPQKQSQLHSDRHSDASTQRTMKRHHTVQMDIYLDIHPVVMTNQKAVAPLIVTAAEVPLALDQCQHVAQFHRLTLNWIVIEPAYLLESIRNSHNPSSEQRW